MDFKYIVFALIIFTGFSCAQDITPPDHVLIEFQKLYPDVKDVAWEKEGDNFEAEFYVDGDEISVEFNANGEVLETEIEEDEKSDINDSDNDKDKVDEEDDDGNDN